MVVETGVDPRPAAAAGPGGKRVRLLAAAPLVLAAWTLFVWGGRLRNLWQEPGPLTDVSRWPLVASVSFCLLALTLVTLAALRRLASSVGRLNVAALAILTGGVWLVRGLDIALGDHSAAFIAVHVVLAVVSIALAAAALRWHAGARSGLGAVA